MTEYDRYYQRALSAAAKAGQAYEEKRKALADTAAAQKQQAAAEKAQAADEELAARQQALPEQYRRLFDRNAVEQAVRSKRLSETLANMGLTESGLNRSQQTALALRRARADADTRLQQQAAYDALERQRADASAAAAAEKAGIRAEEQEKALDDILQADSAREKTAREAALSAYKAELDAADRAAKAKAQQDEADRQSEERERTLNESRRLLYYKCLAAGWTDEDAWQYALRKYPLGALKTPLHWEEDELS